MGLGIALLVVGFVWQILVFQLGRAADRTAARSFINSWEDLPTPFRLAGLLGTIGMVVGVVLIVVSLVSGDDDNDSRASRGVEWSADEIRTFRSQLCGDVLRVSETGDVCDCVTAATQGVYADASDFFESDEPSTALESAWRRCGVGRT